MSAHTSEKIRLDLSSRKEDAVIISNKDGETRKRTGAKAKKTRSVIRSRKGYFVNRNT